MTARLAALVVCGLIAPLPALAHHSFSAVFDQNQTVSLDGTARDFVRLYSFCLASKTRLCSNNSSRITSIVFSVDTIHDGFYINRAPAKLIAKVFDVAAVRCRVCHIRGGNII